MLTRSVSLRWCVGCAAFISLFLALPTVPVFADQYWDIDGATAGAGGATPSGAWTGSNWTASTTGTTATTTWGSFENAFFSAGSNATGSFNVTVAGTQSINNLQVDEGTPTISGGTLNFGSPTGGPALTVASGLTANISSTLTRQGGQVYMTKRGTGTLNLSGTGSSGQGLAVYQGTLAFTGGSMTFSNDSYIGSTGAAACCSTTDVNGNGTLIVNGATLTFNGTNFVMGQTLNGATKVAQYTQQAGSVTVNSSFIGIGNGTGVSQLDISGGSFSAGASMNLGVRGASTLNISGTGAVTLGGLIFGHGSTGGANNITNLDGGTLTVASITKGSGTATFNFNGGTLKAGASSTTFMQGLNTANVKAGGAFIDTNGKDITIAQALLNSGGGGLTKDGAGKLTLSSGANTYVGTTTINAGTLEVTTGVGSINSASAISIGGSGTLTYALNGATVPNNISGAGTINLSATSGLQNFAFTGSNSGFTGTINVNNFGRLIVGSGWTTTAGEPASTAQINVANGGALYVAGAAAAIMNNPINITGDGVSEGAPGPYGALRVDAGAAYGGNVTLVGNARIGGASAGNGTLTGNIIIGGNTLTLNTSNSNLTFNGNLTSTAAGSVSKTGNFSVILGGNNSGFTGTYNNNQSNTFFNGANSGSANAAWVLNAGNVANVLTGAQAVSLGSLAGNAGAQLGNNVGSSTVNYSIGALNTSTTYAGTIVDSIGGGGTTAITKVGTGDLTLSGANSYSGGTQVNAGRLVLNGAGTFGTGPVTVAAGAEVFIAGAGTHNNTFNISGDGGTGSSIDPALRGAIRIEGATIGGSVVLQANSSLGSYNGNTGTINAVISESGGARALSINKEPFATPGTIVLGGANTFSGDTRIYNGTLRLNNILALQNSTVDMNAADAGALSFGTLTSATFGGLKGSRNLSLNNTTPAAVALTVGNNNQSNTYSGQLSGSGSLTKIGTGTQTFTGASTYSGATSVQGGTLELGPGGSIANTASVTVGASGNGGSDRLLLNNAAAHRLGMGDLVVGSTEAGTVDHNAGNVTVGDNDAGLENVRIGVGANGTYNIGGSGPATLNVGDNGTGNVNGGRGTLTVGDSGGFNGALNVHAGAVINTGDLKVGNGAAGGVVTQDGGTINVLNNNTYTLNASDSPVLTATTNQTGGLTNVTGGMVLGNSVGAATQNQYNLSGGVLDFGDTAGASAHWGAGTSPSSLTINSDATFSLTGTGTLQDVTTINTAGGTGTFTQNGGTFIIGQNEPDGNAPNNLARETTINGGFSLLAGIVRFDAFGPDLTPELCCDGVPSQNDQLTVNGDLLLDSTVSLDFVGFTPEFGDAFTLFCADTITLGDNFGIDGGFFRVIPDGQGGFALQAIVPEPASIAVWTMIGLAGAAGAWRMRRKGSGNRVQGSGSK